MNAHLLALARMEPKTRVMTIGAADSYQLFYILSGICYMLSDEDRAEYHNFVEYLYTKYGRDNAFGWYKSLDNFTQDSQRSVELFFAELMVYTKPSQ